MENNQIKHQIEGAHFDIHASVVFRLGEELITDEMQALIELVKNSYDADATWARVIVNTEDVLDNSYLYAGTKGYIIVEDNGIGMRKSAIEDGWLFISNSIKRSMKEKGEVTGKYGRIPLGDKGLGRLGVQRLGHNVEIITRPEEEPGIEYHVGFSWDAFLNEKRLTKIPVKFYQRSTSDKPGTKLVISNLVHTNTWRSDNSVSDLQAKLSHLISPFEAINQFRVNLRVNGLSVDLAEIAGELRETAQLRYEIDFDKIVFQVVGHASFDYISPPKKEMDLFRELVLSDNGKRFLAFLKEEKSGKDYKISRSKTKKWFIDYTLNMNFENFSLLALYDGYPANPGEFHGEVDHFDFREGAEQQDVFANKDAYKDYIKDLSGIRVYRDGFGIRVDKDWLELGSAATSARSRYVLKPDNTIGYISISSGGNSNLRETTNRQDFIEDAFYQNFRAMLLQFIDFSNNSQNFIKRGWHKYRDKHAEKNAFQMTNQSTPQDVTKHLKNEAVKIHQKLEQSAKELEFARKKRENEQKYLFPEDDQRLIEMNQVLEQNVAVTNEVIAYVSAFSKDAGFADYFETQLTHLQIQLSDAYETMGLGLTAEALSHEFNNVTLQLSDRTEQVRQYLEKKKPFDPTLISYIEYVRSSIAALRKQLSHFTPSLKYVRDKRENIDLVKFFGEIQDYYQSRFANKNIELRLDNQENFKIYINKGKLTQIIDNLVLNSEYWIKEDLRLGHLDTGIISIEIKKPFFRVFDNGRGIENSVESSLFEPFITMKGKNKGRGLGLFIVNQLLDSDGCSIQLLSERNKYARLYKFEVDLNRRISE